MLKNIVIASFLIFNFSALTKAQQAIFKNHTEKGNMVIYSPKETFVTGGGDKGLKLSATFLTELKTSELKDFRGFNYFTLGLGKCFFKDEMKLTLQNGKQVNLISSNPELCDEHRSGWFDLTCEQFDTLFSAPLKRIYFKNNKTGQELSEDIIDVQEQMYFLIIKELVVKKEYVEQG